VRDKPRVDLLFDVPVGTHRDGCHAPLFRFGRLTVSPLSPVRVRDLKQNVVLLLEIPRFGYGIAVLGLECAEMLLYRRDSSFTINQPGIFNEFFGCSFRHFS
jgi:hypothetical protein